MLELFKNGLQGWLDQRSAQNLGDRKKYLGMSEIAGCTRKTILDKIKGQDFHLETLMLFLYGHLFEDALAEIIEDAGYLVKRNVEVRPPSVPFVLGHIDIMVVTKTTDYIIEVKTCEELPDGPKAYHEQQLLAQVNGWKEMHPDREVQGGLFYAARSKDGGVAYYNEGYTPHDPTWDFLKQTASAKWLLYQEATKDLHNPDLRLPTEPGPLCEYCGHGETCPELQAETINGLLHIVAKERECASRIGKINTHRKRLRRIIQSVLDKRDEQPFRAGPYIVDQGIKKTPSYDNIGMIKRMEEHGLPVSDLIGDVKTTKYPLIKRIKAA